MEFEIGDKVVMNRKSRKFKEIGLGISLAWWLVLEKNQPITITNKEMGDWGVNVYTTSHNGLQVMGDWILPYEED